MLHGEPGITAVHFSKQSARPLPFTAHTQHALCVSALKLEKMMMNEESYRVQLVKYFEFGETLCSFSRAPSLSKELNL